MNNSKEYCCLQSETVISLTVLYGCQTRSVIPREEHNVRPFQNEIPRRTSGLEKEVWKQDVGEKRAIRSFVCTLIHTDRVIDVILAPKKLGDGQSPNIFNAVTASCYFMYHQIQRSIILCSRCRLQLCVVSGSDNKQRLFPNTALTN